MATIGSTTPPWQGWCIHHAIETDRQAAVAQLLAQIPQLKLSNAVYPSAEKVAFLDRIGPLTQSRTGQALRPAEVGCLLSHRAVWQQLIAIPGEEETHYLVVESDSLIEDVSPLLQQKSLVEHSFDLFFWGAWDGHSVLYPSTQRKVSKTHRVGEGYLASLYGTYGYSLNRKAAIRLLAATRRFSYPVDFFKHWLDRADLRVGLIQPEVITTHGQSVSQIRSSAHWSRFSLKARQRLHSLRHRILVKIK